MSFLSKFTGKEIEDKLDAPQSGQSYKVYTATIKKGEVNTELPEIVVLENTLGGTVTWTRMTDNGVYYLLTGTGLFAGNFYPYSNFQSDYNDNPVWIHIDRYDDNTCQLRIKNINSWADQDLYTGIVWPFPIEIRVYP